MSEKKLTHTHTHYSCINLCIYIIIFTCVCVRVIYCIMYAYNLADIVRVLFENNNDMNKRVIGVRHGIRDKFSRSVC